MSKKKILLGIITFVILLLIVFTGNVTAEEGEDTTNTTSSTAKGFIWTSDGLQEEPPMSVSTELIGGETPYKIFCMEYGATLFESDKFDYKEGYTKSAGCTLNNHGITDTSNPFSGKGVLGLEGKRHTIQYVKGAELPYTDHQKTCYIIAHTDNMDIIQRTIWRDDDTNIAVENPAVSQKLQKELNELEAEREDPKRPIEEIEADIREKLGEIDKYLESRKQEIKDVIDGKKRDDPLEHEAEDYLQYYNEVQAAGGFNPKDTTNLQEVKVGVNQNTQEYTVGPFSVEYIHGWSNKAGRRVDFSYISDIQVLDQNGNQQEIVAIVDSAGNELRDMTAENEENERTSVYRNIESNQKFYVRFKKTDGATKIKLKVNFEYIYEVKGTLYQFDGTIYEWWFKDEDGGECSSHHTPLGEYGTMKEWVLQVAKYGETSTAQKMVGTPSSNLLAFKTLEDWRETELIVGGQEGGIDITMELAGYVWVDAKSNKDNLPDGRDGTDPNDKKMKGVEVILYTSDGQRVGGSVTNPVITGEDGAYKFEGLDAMKKYHIEFIYDGQLYENTIYTKNLTGGYSNATENITDRTSFNLNFEEIGSANTSYRVRKPLSELGFNEGDYNLVYPKNVIGGTVYDEEDETALANLKEFVTYQGRKMSLREFVTLKAIETRSYKAAYQAVLSSSECSHISNLRSKLQFIEDCRISAYTGTNTSGNSFGFTNYPEENMFTTKDRKYVGSNSEVPIGGQYFSVIYDRDSKMGGYSVTHIDYGTTARTTLDLSVASDLYRATTTINGKTQVYKYERRKTDVNDEENWEISVRQEDVGYFTNPSGYTRDLFQSDYDYRLSENHQGAELEVYLTYRITIKNQSPTVKAIITELVDYYDEDLEYIDELSGVQVGRANLSNFEDIMARGYIEYNETTTRANASSSTKYTNSTDNTPAGYDAVYISGLNGTKLRSGQKAYVFLTFKVKKGDSGILLDETVQNGQVIDLGVGKENIAEINGYKSYYREQTDLPRYYNSNGNVENNQQTPNDQVVAGLIDIDSTPGNLNPADVPKDGTPNYNNFEDDTDKAPSIKIKIYRDENGVPLTRQLKGVVWEDLRDTQSGDAYIGNGIRQDNETKIQGVTVQLVELLDNGQEFVWEEYYSGQTDNLKHIVYLPNELLNEQYELDSNYSYDFRSYIPGNYIVRFKYGDTMRTVSVNNDDMVYEGVEKGLNGTSYNGQDYKSTSYQKGISGNEAYENVTTGSYVYDIAKSDNNQNLSDAKDLWQNVEVDGRIIAHGRQGVIEYSDGYSDKNGERVTNHIAEVLASPDKNNLTQQQKQGEYLQELIDNTWMQAETGTINIEIEYNRNLSDGYDDVSNREESNTDKNGSDKNGTYIISDVDFGLEERPKAQVLLKKEVDNVRVTLANGTVLFDTDREVTNVSWIHKIGHTFFFNNDKIHDATRNNGLPYFINSADNTGINNGLVNLTIDSELLHGSSLLATYKYTAVNVGEVDYTDAKFYYTGQEDNPDANISTTRVDQMIDYVRNNLQFDEQEGWSRVSIQKNPEIVQSELMGGNVEDNAIINSARKDSVAEYNNVLLTNNSSITKDLVPYTESIQNNNDYENLPEESKSETILQLSKLITTTSEEDDLTYDNLGEIVQISNSNGRRMAYSVVGNQDPIDSEDNTAQAEPSELDTANAEQIIINPPTGENRAIYIILPIVAVVIIAAGIIIIKKKVL